MYLTNVEVSTADNGEMEGDEGGCREIRLQSLGVFPTTSSVPVAPQLDAHLAHPLYLSGIVSQRHYFRGLPGSLAEMPVAPPPQCVFSPIFPGMAGWEDYRLLGRLLILAKRIFEQVLD